MGFKEQRRKFFTFKNLELDYHQREFKQAHISLTFGGIFRRYNPVLKSSKKILDLSTEWEPMEQELLGGVAQVDRQYKVWEIEINAFDVRLLPFLRVKVLYRNIEGDTDDETYKLNQLFFYDSYSYEVNDIKDEDHLKLLKIIATFYVNSNAIEYPYEVKLMVTFINPREFL